jgi:DNA-binding PadR family transcriptional regulator
MDAYRDPTPLPAAPGVGLAALSFLQDVPRLRKLQIAERNERLVRRKGGTGLVRNELRLLLTAADLRLAGADRFHGYDIARHLAAAEDSKSIMSQPTLYRALRRLEERGALESEWESLQDAAASGREGRPRRYYRLTAAGAELANSELRSQQLKWAGGKLLPNTN